jgi:hypothetical protein
VELTDREAREWRLLAIAAAAAIVLLVVRILAGRPLTGRHPVRDLRAARVGEPGEPVAEEDLFTETRAQEITRRLEACEAHLQNLPPERGM